MIQLTRLNNSPFFVNADLIKFVEECPDTFVTLTTGEKLVVREKATEVLNRVIEFRRAVLQQPSFTEDVTVSQGIGLITRSGKTGDSNK